MRFLVDTHVVVWWYLDAPQLPDAFRDALERLQASGQSAGVCAIPLWEIAKLTERGRLQINLSLHELLEQVENDPLFEVIALCAPIAAESTRVGPSSHKDPADQLITATARCLGLKSMTCDEAILKSNAVALVGSR